MRKILSLSLLALLLLSGPAPSARTSRFTALFCPECWTYLFGHGTTDLRGNCAACGKYPLEIEVQEMKWFWCSRQHRWLTEECKENAERRCCTMEDALAAVEKPGPGLLRAAYCPLHRSFNGVRMPLLGILTCASDGRPMTPVWAVRHTWFWCAMEGQWIGSRCALDPVKHCCTPHEGLLVATPEPGPIAEQ
jgi:hypothetical protein